MMRIFQNYSSFLVLGANFCRLVGKKSIKKKNAIIRMCGKKYIAEYIAMASVKPRS